MKKNSFEDFLAKEMSNNLIKNASVTDTSKDLNLAIDCLGEAADILDLNNLESISNKVLNVLIKIAKDRHTDGLTSEKMVENLLDHGTEFNLSDDMDDILINDIDSKKIDLSEDDLLNMDFEDEI